jgi:hypothetical protein
LTGKNIESLVADIEGVLVNGIPSDVSPEVIEKFGKSLAETIAKRLIRVPREPTLRMSNIGQPCERKLWYELHNPELAEELRAETYLKFLYGDLTELMILFLVELAGHKVEGLQQEQDIEGIKGHWDCIIDGRIFDIKSASSFSFKKFKGGKLKEDDPFGYIPQLQSYLQAGQDNPLVTDKDHASFLVFDKSLGHICVDTYEKDTSIDWKEFYNKKKEMVKSDTPPDRGFEDIPFQASGNMKLGVNCSYCSFAQTCWPEARKFLYSFGPVTLTKIVKEPNVMEIK